MNRKDLLPLIFIAVSSAVIAWVITGILFKAPANRGAQAPTAPVITSSFPDVKNDPAYKNFLNDQALNPAQPIQIGDSNNSTPFNSAR